jgi:2-methylaconitate cis-trans-isomerase PrpF
MGMGDCSALVVPKPVFVAPPRGAGTIASRDFVPFNCHATYSVTGSIALSVASILEGTVANRLARVDKANPGLVRIEHPGGTIDVNVEARPSRGGLEVGEASLLRTCRKLFEGQICIPSRVWDGSGKARDAAELARAT